MKLLLLSQSKLQEYGIIKTQMSDDTFVFVIIISKLHEYVFIKTQINDDFFVIF